MAERGGTYERHHGEVVVQAKALEQDDARVVSKQAEHQGERDADDGERDVGIMTIPHGDKATMFAGAAVLLDLAPTWSWGASNRRGNLQRERRGDRGTVGRTCHGETDVRDPISTSTRFKYRTVTLDLFFVEGRGVRTEENFPRSWCWSRIKTRVVG